MASEVAMPQGESESEQKGGAGMDYPAHEHTYEGFIHYSIVLSIMTFTILVALVLFGFGGGAGFWLGLLIVILSLGAAAIGIGSGGAWKPGVAVMGLGALFVILTV